MSRFPKRLVPFITLGRHSFDYDAIKSPDSSRRVRFESIEVNNCNFPFLIVSNSRRRSTSRHQSYFVTLGVNCTQYVTHSKNKHRCTNQECEEILHNVLTQQPPTDRSRELLSHATEHDQHITLEALTFCTVVAR